MNLAVITRSDENIQDIADLTHPIMERFASRWKADFIVLTSGSPEDSGIKSARSESSQCEYLYRIVKVQKLLSVYDRVVLIDTDVIINKTCPNPFDAVPEDSIGSTYEDWGPADMVAARRELMRKIQAEWGDVGWKDGYVNDGVFVMSRQHASILDPGPNGRYWNEWGFDDIDIGWQIHKQGMKVHQLDFRWNHLSIFSEPRYGGHDRFASHMIHWAGGWHRKPANIKADVKTIYG